MAHTEDLGNYRACCKLHMGVLLVELGLWRTGIFRWTGIAAFLPLNMYDWVPKDHVVWLVIDTVELLGTPELTGGWRAGRGRAPGAAGRITG